MPKRKQTEKLVAPLQDKLHNSDGRELPDPTPMAPPVGYVKQKSMTDIIREQVRSHHLQMAAEAAGAESFEEADDFDVGDELDPTTPYEAVFDPPPEPPLQAQPAPPAAPTPNPPPDGPAAPTPPAPPAATRS